MLKKYSIYIKLYLLLAIISKDPESLVRAYLAFWENLQNVRQKVTFLNLVPKKNYLGNWIFLPTRIPILSPPHYTSSSSLAPGNSFPKDRYSISI